MKKILAILLAGVLTATAFAGCGGGDNKDSGDKSGGSSSGSEFGDEKDVTLKVWAPDAAVELTTKQVAAFKEKYKDSGVKFNIEVVAQGENEAATQIVTDPDEAADVFGFPSDQLNRLMSSQVLTKVGPKATETIKKECAEAPVKAATVNVKGEEGLYAYPETNDNGYYLVYDNTVVKDPSTLEGILADCKAAGKTFIMDGGNGFYSCIFTFTGGAIIDGFEEDGTTQKFVDYKEDDVVKVLMAFAKLMKEYKGTYVHDNVAAISTGFTTKKVGAGIDGPWDTAANKKALGDKMGAAKLPTVNVDGTAKQMVGLFGYKYIGVNSHTKFPVTSAKLAQYLTSEECQKQRAEELGWGPANTAAMDAVSSDPVLKALKEQSDPACSVPQVNISQTLWTSLGTLGAEMYKDSWKADDAAATKALFKKAISNIRDE